MSAEHVQDDSSKFDALQVRDNNRVYLGFVEIEERKKERSKKKLLKLAYKVYNLYRAKPWTCTHNRARVA